MMHLAEPSDHAAAPLSEAEAERQVHGICFKTGPPGKVGVELEWLVCGRDPAQPVPHDTVASALAALAPPGSLPGNGRLTVEPGGQVELSSAPAAAIGDCVTAAGRDLQAMRRAVAPAGLTLVGQGLDPYRPPSRVLDLPRYAAMEEFFDRSGPWGRVMMCSTASVQVCVDAGQEETGVAGFRFRWRLLHALGPVLVAAFANSPLRDGRPTGWKSTRQAVWGRLDPTRTRAPAGAEPAAAADPDAADPRDQWVSYVLDAQVMCVREARSLSWSAPEGLTFRDWLRGAGERQPTADDLTFHLSTLFPPVRPRGHLELRVIDAQPADGWIVPAAVVSALLDDRAAADAAMAAAEEIWPIAVPALQPGRGNGHGGNSQSRDSNRQSRDSNRQSDDSSGQSHGGNGQSRDSSGQSHDSSGQSHDSSGQSHDSSGQSHGGSGQSRDGSGPRRSREGAIGGTATRTNGASPWLRAARLGLTDPGLARAGQVCFEEADAALSRARAPASVRSAVAVFAEQYVLRSRCPADDLLQERR